jgi:hypothetical protein
MGVQPVAVVLLAADSSRKPWKKPPHLPQQALLPPLAGLLPPAANQRRLSHPRRTFQAGVMMMLSHGSLEKLL